jgi:membrane-bound serine protease (ClpP class)
VIGGIALLLLEVFVIPGFGIAGVLGAMALLTGLVMSLVGAGVTLAGILGAAAQVAVALGVALVGAALLFRFLPRLPFGRRLVLESRLAPAGLSPDTAKIDMVLPGDFGRAASALRPSGIAEFAGTRLDAISEGEYIPAGAPLELLRVEQGHVVVRRAVETGKG